MEKADRSPVEPGSAGTRASAVRRSRRSPAEGINIGIVGTFDVANFGDVLFPLLAEEALTRRLGPVSLHRYSLRPMAAPPWMYSVAPIDELLASVDELALLVVGGGHVVRFDHRVAPGYEATSAAISSPTGYWLVPTLAAASAGVPVAWNAVGASTQTPAWARDLLAAALEATDYASVRDGPSLQELGQVAPSANLRLVPDSAFGIARLTGGGAAASTTRGRPDASPYVVIQASAALRPYVDHLRAAVAAATSSGRRVVELPISPVLGDRFGAIGSLGATEPQDPWPDPLAIARVIAGAEAVVGVSLHLSIVAASHGVPVLRPPAPGHEKYREAEGLAGITTISDNQDIAAWLRTSARGRVAPSIVERSAQVEAHWDHVAALVERGGAAAPRRRQAARRILARLPATLEAASEAADRVVSSPADADPARRAAQLADALSEATTLVAHQATELEAAALRVARAEEDGRAAGARAVDLAQSVARLEADLASERLRAAADRGRLDAEMRAVKGRLDAARAASAEARKRAAALEKLQGRRSVRLATQLADGVRRVGRRVRAGSRPIRALGPANRATAKTRQPGEAEAQSLTRELLAQAPGSPRVDGPQVSVVILNHNGLAHLKRILPALAATTYRAFDVVVVDNASTDGSREELGRWSTRLPLTVIANGENVPFGDGNNQAVRAASGDLLLFLNNDIEPLTNGWLGRLVDTLEAEGAAAVGARLVYPLRAAESNAGDRRLADLTLQHRGIHFIGADGIPTGRNLGAGESPIDAAASRVGDVAAATAACLLVRRTSFEAVGGFTTGYSYGTEDVDLSIKLRAAGGRIVYDGLAVLWHHEYGTQNAQGQDWKRRNRARNRQLFVNRLGPQVFREVLRDRLMGAGRWSEEAIHVAVTLTRDDPSSGWGDYYTAHELGDALGDLGWKVTYAERYQDRWYQLDPSVDVVVSLLDSYDIRRIHRGAVTIAWVRNWTDRWLGHPWFDEYDIVLASSGPTRNLIEAGSSHQAAIMPLATNPARFARRPADPGLASDLVFVGNHWGEARWVESVLPQIAQAHRVRVFGRGWQETALAQIDGGPLDYDRLPTAYSSARLVLDDTAGPTIRYGAVNSRVFDALAAGALVVSDNEVGIRELFGDEFPVASDAAELEAFMEWVDANPAEAAALQERLRETVVGSHTYQHRAREIRDHLLAWTEADRYSILVGIPDWSQAHLWGDYHYARALQRQLERVGHPTRVHLLDEWNRSPSARSDVVIHLHGLSDHKARPAQLNVLWAISHPDRLTPAVCDRYDLAFIASDMLAAELAPRTSVPVLPLHQATDPERFFPEEGGQPHELLFVGNTRGTRRMIIDDILPTVHDLAVYGKGWTDELIGPALVRGEHIPNALLHRYYAAASIVLNDHWPDMRSLGFLSNRLYDALASGAFVLSDHATGIDEEFEGAVETYLNRDDLKQKVSLLLADPDLRRERAERGRAVVLARHTFAHRTAEILAAVRAFDDARPRDLASWRPIDRWLERRARRIADRAPAGTSADM